MKPGLQLELGPSALDALVGEREAPRWSDRFAFGSTDELQEAVRLAATASAPHRSPKAIVRIDPALLQQRVLTDLPPVSGRALQALVARGTSRFFRQNGHPLVSGAIWSAVGEHDRAAVVVALDGHLAEAVVGAATASGLRIEDIVPRDGPGGLSLLPVAERGRQQRATWRQVRAMALSTVALWLVVLGAIGGHRWRELRQNEAELARLREPRDAVLAARRATDEASAMISAMRHATVRRQSVARWLSAMTGVLPDSAFIEEIDLTAGGTGSLKGRAREPSVVHERLQRIDGVRVLTFKVNTAASPGSADGWQGFTATVAPGRER